MKKENTIENLAETKTNNQEKYPFRKYLFETALIKDKTGIKNRNEFEKNVEIYKKLKEMTYIGPDRLDFVVDNSGTTETVTRDEAVLFVSAFEKKAVDAKILLQDVKKHIKELHREPKIVVYTCITGGYDKIKEPSLITPGVDYICFTDNETMKSKTWKNKPIPKELLSLSSVKQQRGIKLLPHRYLNEYDVSVWVDGNMDVKGNIKDYLKTLNFEDYTVFIPEHPARKCIYKEKDECLRQKKITGDGIALAEKQMGRYKDEGFPANYGLVQTNIMVRKHNDQYCINLMEKWWSELRDYSHRDQLSFNYALWKIGNDKFKYLIKTTCNSKTFKWGISHAKKK